MMLVTTIYLLSAVIVIGYFLDMIYNKENNFKLRHLILLILYLPFIIITLTLMLISIGIRKIIKINEYWLDKDIYIRKRN